MERRLRIGAVSALVLAALAWTVAARAAYAVEQAPAGTHGGLAMDETAAAPTGGNRYGTPFQIPASVRSFSASPRSTYVAGAPTTLRFRIDAVNRRSVRVVLAVRRVGGGARGRDVSLGTRRTNVSHTYRWRRSGVGTGSWSLTLRVLDASGRAVARTARATLTVRVRPRPRPRPRPIAPAAPVSGANGVFPIAGSYSYGEGFGAPRPGRTHQGQDLSAAAGTPLRSPRNGTVTTVGYQATGAGNYVVIRDSAVDRSYVFMHLQDGSTAVSEGQSVRAGQHIGRVGSTGRSTGPHLHFEVWVGGWWGGGHAIDPLPTLRSWAR